MKGFRVLLTLDYIMFPLTPESQNAEQGFQGFLLFGVPMNSTPNTINRIIATGFNRRRAGKL